MSSVRSVLVVSDSSLAMTALVTPPFVSTAAAMVSSCVPPLVANSASRCSTVSVGAPVPVEVVLLPVEPVEPVEDEPVLPGAWPGGLPLPPPGPGVPFGGPPARLAASVTWSASCAVRCCSSAMVVTVPITAHTTAISVTAETTSRVRRVRGLFRRCCSFCSDLPSLRCPPAFRLLLTVLPSCRARPRLPERHHQ